MQEEKSLSTSSAIAGETVYNLGSSQLIPPGEGRVYVVEGQSVAVFRTRSGRVYAVQAECPHRGGPLIDGLVGDGKVICPLHSFAFDLTTGNPIENSCERLRSYSVALNAAGEILLTLVE